MAPENQRMQDVMREGMQQAETRQAADY